MQWVIDRLSIRRTKAVHGKSEENKMPVRKLQATEMTQCVNEIDEQCRKQIYCVARCELPCISVGVYFLFLF